MQGKEARTCPTAKDIDITERGWHAGSGANVRLCVSKGRSARVESAGEGPALGEPHADTSRGAATTSLLGSDDPYGAVIPRKWALPGRPQPSVAPMCARLACTGVRLNTRRLP